MIKSGALNRAGGERFGGRNEVIDDDDTLASKEKSGSRYGVTYISPHEQIKI